MAAGPVARAAVCSKGVDGWADKRRSAGGTGLNILPSNDVRFCAHNGLMADIRPGPFCAIMRPFEMSKFRSTNHSSFWIVRFSQAIQPPTEIFRAVKRTQILC